MKRGLFVVSLCLGTVVLAVPVSTQEKGGLDLYGDYSVVEGWFKPVVEGYLLSPVTVFSATPDRIFVGAGGLTPKATAPPTLQNFNPKTPGAKFDHRIVALNQSGQMAEWWSQWDSQLVLPHKITISPYDPQKHVWVVDRDGHRVLKFTSDGKQLVMALGEFGVAGKDDKHFGRPSDIAFLPDGTFYVSDGYDNRRVLKFDKDGKLLLMWGSEGTAPGQFMLVHSVSLDAKGRVYVLDRGNDRVQVFDENGKFLDQWPGLLNPARLLVTEDGFAWVSDTRANKFAKYDLNGKLLTTFGTGGAAGSFPGVINVPHDFSVDSEGNLYVANAASFSVDKYVPKKTGDRRRLIGQPFWAKGDKR